MHKKGAEEGPCCTTAAPTPNVVYTAVVELIQKALPP
jgi:hypothetical protein